MKIKLSIILIFLSLFNFRSSVSAQSFVASDNKKSADSLVLKKDTTASLNSKSSDYVFTPSIDKDIQHGLMIVGALIAIAFILPLIVIVIGSIRRAFLSVKCPKCGFHGSDITFRQIPDSPQMWIEKYLYLNCAHCHEVVLVKTWTRMADGSIHERVVE